MAAFAGTQVLAALAGLWVGRHLDRYGPRLLMTFGSVLGVVAVLCLAAASVPAVVRRPPARSPVPPWPPPSIRPRSPR